MVTIPNVGGAAHMYDSAKMGAGVSPSSDGHLAGVARFGCRPCGGSSTHSGSSVDCLFPRSQPGRRGYFVLGLYSGESLVFSFWNANPEIPEFLERWSGDP